VIHRKVRALLFALVAAVVLTLLGVLIFATGRPPPPPALPNPNGYDDFLKAASLLTGEVADASGLDHEHLRDLVATDSEPLRLLRLGLTRRCAVPTDSASTNWATIAQDLARLKLLAWLLRDEGRLAEMENRPVDAARAYIDAIHFGNEMSRGGFIIYRLVGLACEALGVTPLANLTPQLDCHQAREIITELKQIDSATVTWQEVMQAENRFSRHQLHRIHNPLALAADWWQNRTAKKRAEERHNRMAARLRLLTAEFALRCYRSEHGRAPIRLEELLPGLIQRVPLDPFTGRPLIYRAQGTNWLLYSVGADGVDDGGKPVGRSATGGIQKGDLFFDSPW